VTPDGWERVEAIAALKLDHPMRMSVVRHLYQHGEASPKVMFRAYSGDETFELYAYHVRRLASTKVIRLKSKQMVGGAVEHTYTLTAAARKTLEGLIDDD
jgi:hypothetical protein